MTTPLPDKTDSRRRRVWRWLGYGTLGALALGAVAAGAGAWWLWGWRTGGLTFHESWTPEQQAELSAFDEAIKLLPAKVAAAHLESVQSSESAPVGPLRSRWLGLKSRVQSRHLLAAWRDALCQAAVSGRGDAPIPLETPSGYTLAQAACACGQLRLVPALVSHGADPNAGLILPEDGMRETLFQTAIVCVPAVSILGQDVVFPPVAERLALLEQLLAAGAVPEGVGSRPGYSLLLAWISAGLDSAAEPDRGVIAEWLLEHGVQPRTDEDVANVLSLLSIEGTLPAMRRIVQEKKLLEACNPDVVKLCALSGALRCAAADAPQKLRWAINELGADPQGDVRIGEWSLPAITLGLTNLTTAIEQQEPRRIEIALAALDILLENGARPSVQDIRKALPQQADLRAQYMNLLHKHNIHLSDK